MSSPAELAAPQAQPAPAEARSGRSRSRRPGNRRANPRAERHAAARAARRAAMPPITYPPELPVSQRKDEIARAIRDHQVVIVAGETGSGKTTQLPKICLELGRGVAGQIGHTQPRRLAARTVAERIAEELGSPLGEAVGYQVRFTDVSADDTLVKLMTDGILLTEMARDRTLSRYDTLIIDEAHERSLNIDFILGYLRQLLPDVPTSRSSSPRRPSTRSASPRPSAARRSSRCPAGPIRSRCATGRSRAARTPTRARRSATRSTSCPPRAPATSWSSSPASARSATPPTCWPGVTGSRSCRSTPGCPPPSSTGSSPGPRQHTRRVVLATNVAETSLTVPGIRYVIDPGTARISRYSYRTKVQRLPIEPISQASANQRKGRCGRIADGICIRLYSEEDFESRPEFTEPEILRTNLASVILQMAALGLGDVPKFPFLDPPDARNIGDGLTLLAELGALADGRITGLGRKLARLPVDPRLGRMVLEADRNGCVREVLVIAAALSIQDPRERPADAQQAADEAHRRFADPTRTSPPT